MDSEVSHQELQTALEKLNAGYYVRRSLRAELQEMGYTDQYARLTAHGKMTLEILRKGQHP